MKQNKFGQLVFQDHDMCDLLMQGHDLASLRNMVVEPQVDFTQLQTLLPDLHSLHSWQHPEPDTSSVQEFHTRQQRHWHMPDEYRHMDIAEHVLNLCASEAELQRCGAELLLFQERDLFDLLRYLKYLVDVMKENRVIWGVGRGSSVASYVLYKLGVHRIDSMYYDLDPREFLR